MRLRCLLCLLFRAAIGGDRLGVELQTEPRSCCGSLMTGATHTVDKIAAVTLGRYGGPSSSSMVEDLLALRRSSTSRCHQVVRPRRLRVGRWQRLIAGGETASIPLTDLGASSTLRSPATGGGEAQAPDCFFAICAEGLVVSTEALSSNTRFFRASVGKGPLCKMYPLRGLI